MGLPLTITYSHRAQRGATDKGFGLGAWIISILETAILLIMLFLAEIT